jgi:hypothetical protein
VDALVSSVADGALLMARTGDAVLIVFCADPLQPHRVDAAWSDEADAARSAGLTIAVIDFESLTTGALERAVHRVPTADLARPRTAVYGGWMLRPDLSGLSLERTKDLPRDVDL